MAESLIAVTGAAGHLGRLVVEGLIGRGVPAGRVVAAVRSPEKAAGLASRGVLVREADYERPETLGAASRCPSWRRRSRGRAAAR